jgi:OOP family OmpA-OmpF porin
VLIEGHTDSKGSDAYNLSLSDRRAKSVYDYLTSRGVDPARLSSIGKGESMPIADNETEEGRQQNRRVMLIRTDSGM